MSTPRKLSAKKAVAILDRQMARAEEKYYHEYWLIQDSITASEERIVFHNKRLNKLVVARKRERHLFNKALIAAKQKAQSE